MALIVGDGTPEADWAAWSALDALPPLDLGACARAVAVAAHPDDETLGVGGLLARLFAVGRDVLLVAVTDGEASHPGGSLSPARLAELRRAEGREALRALGGTELLRLGQPDGAVNEGALAEHLAALLRPDDWCLATWEDDGHPDHEAVGLAARTACARTGARLVQYPVWLWHWAVPADPRVPWAGLRRVELDPDMRARKTAALTCFRSQTRVVGPLPTDAPVLPPGELAHHTRAYEVVWA